MDSRKCIGIIYNNSKLWIGGAYYIQNLVSSLTLQSDDEQPYVDVYCNDDKSYEELCDITNYKYLRKNRYICSKFKMLLNRILYFLGLYKWIAVNTFKFNKEDIFIYPISGPYNLKERQVGWIADFQYCHYPQYFSKKELISKHVRTKMLSQRKSHVVFSSHDSYNDYKRFYHHNKIRPHIIHFAVTLPDFSNEKIDILKSKYGINDSYYFCPNQFWKHKNHLFLFESFMKFKMTGGKGLLVCTGYPKDYRDPKYSDTIINLLNKEEVKNCIKVLGFIDRKEMLCLMDNAIAVLQPSLFEGWSTVVEDAKALGKYVYLSDIPVHKEQMKYNVCFFDPLNKEDLVSKLRFVRPQTIYKDYNQNRKEFSDSFISLINEF